MFPKKTADSPMCESACRLTYRITRIYSKYHQSKELIIFLKKFKNCDTDNNPFLFVISLSWQLQANGMRSGNNEQKGFLEMYSM
ncbi:MAG: hypothetical protein FD188_3565 [Ignavibacteria bacterium]|nr:MAG: hypothetical protein FD188_3565 [Ignavibacteria bacterium]